MGGVVVVVLNSTLRGAAGGRAVCPILRHSSFTIHTTLHISFRVEAKSSVGKRYNIECCVADYTHYLLCIEIS